MESNSKIPDDHMPAAEGDAWDDLDQQVEAVDGQLTPRARLALLIAPRRVQARVVSVVAARYALNAPVRVLDGGNLYDAHDTARQVRRLTPDLAAALERISVSRAFTCYQAEALLAQQHTLPVPLLLLDYLNTFADENVPPAHRAGLIRQLLGHLARLSGSAAVGVCVCPAYEPPLVDYLNRLENIADSVLRLEAPTPPQQFRLF